MKKNMMLAMLNQLETGKARAFNLVMDLSNAKQEHIKDEDKEKVHMEVNVMTTKIDELHAQIKGHNYRESAFNEQL